MAAYLQGSPFDHLPNELSLWTFAFLCPKDVASVARVCRLWSQLTHTPLLWKYFYHREQRKMPSKCILEIVGSDWRAAYRTAADLTRNWRVGKHEPYALKGHEGRVWALQLDFPSHTLLSASADSDIRMWDLATRQCTKVLKGHTDEVFCLQYDHTGPGGRLASGSYDATIKLWDMERGKPLRSLVGHNKWVRGIRWHKHQLISASGDASIRLWDIEAGVSLSTLTGHRETVVCIQFDPSTQTVVSGSADSTAMVWDLRLGSAHAPVRTFQGHSKTIVSLQADINGNGGRPLLVTASSDTSIKAWDFATGKCLSTLGGGAADGSSEGAIGHTGIVTAVQFDDARLVSGSCDGTVKIWSWNDRYRREGLSAGLEYSLNQESPVYAVTFDTILVSGDDANTIRVWDFAASLKKYNAANEEEDDIREEGEEDEDHLSDQMRMDVEHSTHSTKDQELPVPNKSKRRRGDCNLC